MNIKIFIVLLFISGPSLAQDIKVEMGPDDKGKSLPKNKKDKGKFERGVWVAHEGFQLKKSPIINSEPSGYKA